MAQNSTLPASWLAKVAADPASSVPGSAPNFGREVLPHIYAVSGRFSVAGQAYPWADQALRDSRQNAEIMRTECGIMECLEARQRGTALLKWHIEPRDNKNEDAKDLAQKVTDILQETWQFLELRRNLLEALWYGRYMTSHKYGLGNFGGKQRQYIKRWSPRQGDKIVFRYDDGTGTYFDDQIGIRVSGGYIYQNETFRQRIEQTSWWGPVYWLTDYERELVAVHRHMIEDGDFYDPQDAGRVNGVGIRDRIYWTWYAMQECLANALNFIERSSMGIEIWKYPAGNPVAEQRTREAAENRSNKAVLLVPVQPGEMADLQDVQIVEPGMGGVDAIMDMIKNFFGHKIKRYILGQTLTSEAESTGLGSGVADAHMATYGDIITYDATKLEETMTDDVVRRVQLFNFPGSAHIKLLFRIDTEVDETESRLAALKTAWEMGAKLPAKDVIELAGSRMAEPDEEVLQNPQMAGGGMPGMGGAMGGQGGNPALTGPMGQDAGPWKPGSKKTFGPMGDMGNAGGDGANAVELQRPGSPDRYSKDASGHEHKGKGEGGGQFTGSGGGGSGGDSDSPARDFAKSSLKKGWSRKVLKKKAAQFGHDPDEVVRHFREFAAANNPQGTTPKMSDEEKAKNKNIRDQEESRRAALEKKSTEAVPAMLAELKSSLPPDEMSRVEAFSMLDDLSPRQMRQYVDAATSWGTANPAHSAINHTVKQLKKLGVKLEQKGGNNSWYGKTENGLSVRVADHLGFDAHDIEIVFDRPPTKEQATRSLSEALEDIDTQGGNEKSPATHDDSGRSVERSQSKEADDYTMINDEYSFVKYARKKSTPGQCGLWDESEHNRDEGGQFTSGSGSNSGDTKPAKPSAVSADSGEFELRNDAPAKPKIEGKPKAKQEALFSKSGLPGQMNMFNDAAVPDALLPKDQRGKKDERTASQARADAAAKQKPPAEAKDDKPQPQKIEDRDPESLIEEREQLATERDKQSKLGDKFRANMAQHRIKKINDELRRRGHHEPSDQEKARMAHAEHFNKVAADPPSFGVNDLQRAESYLIGKIYDYQHAIRKGDIEAAGVKDLLDSMQSEADWYKSLWLEKRDGPKKHSRPTVTYSGHEFQDVESIRVQYAKKSTPGQQSLLGSGGTGENKSKPQGRLKWIAINSGKGDGGGTHVQVDGDGKIAKGPAALTGKSLDNLDGKKEGGGGEGNRDDWRKNLADDAEHRQKRADEINVTRDEVHTAKDARDVRKSREKQNKNMLPTDEQVATEKRKLDAPAKSSPATSSQSTIDRITELDPSMPKALLSKLSDKALAATLEQVEKRKGGNSQGKESGNVGSKKGDDSGGRSSEPSRESGGGAIRSESSGQSGDRPGSKPDDNEGRGKSSDSLSTGSDDRKPKSGSVKTPEKKNAIQLLNEALGRHKDDSGDGGKKSAKQKQLDKLEDQRIALNKQGANSRGSIVSKQRKRVDLDEKIKRLRDEIKNENTATKPTTLDGKPKSTADIHPLAKSAGIKNAAVARKKGVTTLVNNIEPAQKAARESLKQIATRLHSQQFADRVADTIIRSTIEGAVMHGNADKGFDRAVDLIGNKSQAENGDPLDMNVREQFQLAANTLRQSKKEILSALRGMESKPSEPEKTKPDDTEDDAPRPTSYFDSGPVKKVTVTAPGVSHDQVPMSVALAAHRNTSFVPERRAVQRQNEYVSQMNADWDHISQFAKTPEQQESAKEEFERYRKKYLEHTLNVLHASSRTASAMITGPARFPTASNQKKIATEMRRHNDLSEFRTRAMRAIVKKLRPDIGPIKSSDDNAVEHLQQKLDGMAKFQEAAKSANKVIRQHIATSDRDGTVTFKPGKTREDTVKALSDLGLSDIIIQATLKPDYMGRVGVPDYSLKNNNANMRRVKQRIEEVSKMKAGSANETTYSGDVKVSEDPDAARIRIHFPGKPSPESIKALKGSGFRWSPSAGAWQRHLNNAGRYAVNSVLRSLGHEKLETSETHESEDGDEIDIPEMHISEHDEDK